MSDVISINQKEEICRTPLCPEPQHTQYSWPMCESCMVNTVRRFMVAEGSFDSKDVKRAYFWIKYVCNNIEEMVEAEKKAIRTRGADYDRDLLP